ncbi:hypothetical protein ACFV2D_35445 [Streptomyces capillispiralis]
MYLWQKQATPVLQTAVLDKLWNQAANSGDKQGEVITLSGNDHP